MALDCPANGFQPEQTGRIKLDKGGSLAEQFCQARSIYFTNLAFSVAGDTTSIEQAQIDQSSQIDTSAVNENEDDALEEDLG